MIGGYQVDLGIFVRCYQPIVDLQWFVRTPKMLPPSGSRTAHANYLDRGSLNHERCHGI